MTSAPPGPSSGPPETIVCVDCGGQCHLLTSPREDGSWDVGDIVAYRCGDCYDRWDLVLEADDIAEPHDVARGDDHPTV